MFGEVEVDAFALGAAAGLGAGAGFGAGVGFRNGIMGAARTAPPPPLPEKCELWDACELWLEWLRCCASIMS